MYTYVYLRGMSLTGDQSWLQVDGRLALGLRVFLWSHHWGSRHEVSTSPDPPEAVSDRCSSFWAFGVAFQVLKGYTTLCHSVYVYIYIYVCTPIYIHINIHTYIHIHVYLYLCIYRCTHRYTYTKKGIYVYIYIYIHMYTYIYVCIQKCVFIHIHCFLSEVWLYCPVSRGLAERAGLLRVSRSVGPGVSVGQSLETLNTKPQTDGSALNQKPNTAGPGNRN